MSDYDTPEKVATRDAEHPARYNVITASQGGDPWGTDEQEAERYAAQLAGHRRAKFPEFFALVDKYDLQTGDIAFEANPKDDSGQGRDPLNTEKLIEEKPAAQANSFSSRIRSVVRSIGYDEHGKTVERQPPGHDYAHLPIFDIDFPCVLMPTTTEGHHHLIIDRPMSQSQYLGLLDAMVKAGIVQEGYARASRKRTAAWLRTPWTRKVKKR